MKCRYLVASGMIGTVMFEDLEGLAFHADLFTWIETIGSLSEYPREIIRILCAEQYIDLPALDHLGKTLRTFNDSQEDPIVKGAIEDTEKLLEKFHGKIGEKS